MQRHKSSQPQEERQQQLRDQSTKKTTEEILYQPFCYEVKASSLYNERDVLAALKDAAMEMLGNAKTKDRSYLLKEHQLVSNLMITVGWLAIACGLYCFRLQYNKENKMMIFYTALAFWLVALTFFGLDYAYLDHMVTSYSILKPSEKREGISYGLYVHYDCDDGLVRWVRYDRFSLTANIIGGLKRVFKFQHIPYVRGILYLITKVRPKVRSFEHTCFTSEPLELRADASPKMLYTEVCSILETGKQQGDGAGSGSGDSKKTKEVMGWYLERDVTHYFDEKGFVLHEQLGNDLKLLVLN